MPKIVSKISRYLESLTAKELIGEIKKLHKLFPDVREYYQVQFQDNGEEELLEKYKEIIRDEFLPNRGWGDAKLSVARKAVNDFIKLSRNNLNTADIMTYYVEIGVKYTSAYGDINEPFYASMERMYEKAAEYTIEHNLEYEFISRFKKIVEDTDGTGWGFYDNLREMFLEFFPDVPIRDPK
jgi:hypothetical protein